MYRFSQRSKLQTAIASIGVFLFAIGFLVISVDFAILNPLFYRTAFNKHGSAEAAQITEADSVRVYKHMISYFGGGTDDLQIQVTFIGDQNPSNFFDDDELSHMRDVKDVLIGARVFAYCFMAVGACAVAVALIFAQRRFRVDALARGALLGAGSFLLLCALFAVISIFNFEAVFEVFHKILFPQGNWQFAWSSAMIRLLPEGLFLDATVLIMVSGLSFSVLAIAFGCVYLGICSQKKKGRSI